MEIQPKAPNALFALSVVTVNMLLVVDKTAAVNALPLVPVISYGIT